MVTKTSNILIGIGVSVVSCSILYYGLKKYAKYVKRAYHNGKPTIWFRGFDKYKKPKHQQHPRFTQIYKRGDIIVRDFRSSNTSTISSNSTTLRIVSLNMEMGKQINKILKSLQQLKADVIFLQEVDLSTRRAHYVDIVAELSTELNMNSLFTVEVEVDYKMKTKNEKESLIRNKFNAGYEGNAILTKYDFINTKGLIIKCGRYQKYLHKGKTHNEAVAVIDVPQFGRIACYSIHLDPHWCGVEGRIKQYNEIMEDVANTDDVDGFILCGDFNTVCHGLNRLYPSIGCDNHSRFGHFGQTEAQYFQENAVEKANEEYKLDLYDPFDKGKDYTMFNHTFGYTAKVDWCLLSSNLKTIEKKVCAPKERCSDHQWVMVDIVRKC